MNQLPTHCPHCSFKLAPMVYLPAQGDSTNVLHCMNCGWSVEIEPGDAAALSAASEGVSLNDRQWQLILEFMEWSLDRELEPRDTSIYQKVHQELAAIHVRSSNPPQPSMPSVSEGSDVDSSSASPYPTPQLDLEQGSDRKGS